MRTASNISLQNVRAVYSGPEGDLWELIMGEQTHLGGLASSLALAETKFAQQLTHDRKLVQGLFVAVKKWNWRSTRMEVHHEPPTSGRDARPHGLAPTDVGGQEVRGEGEHANPPNRRRSPLNP